MSKISNVIIHCSDSEFGSAAEIRRWHQAKGWDDIGYHFVILNGLLCPDTKWQKKLYLGCMDGSIEVGRKLDGDNLIAGNETGAHALGYNQNSLGLCLIGIKNFTQKQFYSLAQLLGEITDIYGIPMGGVKGHYQVSDTRTCPNFNVPLFIEDLAWLQSVPAMSIDPDKYKLGA